MRFLIDADLPRSTTALLQRYGHEGLDVRDVGLGRAPDREIGRYARDQRLCLVTGDADFSDVRVYPPAAYPGLVVLHVPPDATAPFILALLEMFLNQPAVVNKLVGKLAIVEPGRVRVRSS